ncbi:alkaline phosphatase family protein [uncultured Pseudokineococcus sp.]|uniref:alkaline phosphatase family protein n=1 Tax=uncultured Pseudokineococcus sp. TaxID=1642928 RepID=UPI00261475BE|nr:nucleotide pyrophosphatase/phosphodiesterase family protein [uncultured Pseudokineococcus sp.]
MTPPGGGGGAAAPPAGALADVLPAAAAALGAPQRPVGIALPPAARVCVLLVDGLGDRLLAAAGRTAGSLGELREGGFVLRAGHPSTTATSMGSFGTGLLPGAHGLVGYEVLDPSRGALLNELAWDPAVDPRQWQPAPTVFEHLVAAGVPCTHVGPPHFAGSGLTEAALRGPRYVAARSLQERVDAAASAVRASPRALVYVYWGDLDKTGHERGWQTDAWDTELADVDLAVRQLARRMPADALLLVTADHGMVDVPPGPARLDLAEDGDLALGVPLSGGEPRAPMLYCAPGEAPAVLARWRARLGPGAQVLLREDAVAAGWFGPVADRVLPRIGDVVVSCAPGTSVHDSRTQRPQLKGLVGMHGGRTDDETHVPLLVVAGARTG